MQATDILRNEHRVIEQVLACLEKLAEHFEAGETLDQPSAWQALDFCRNFADSCHRGKEERYLFPALDAHGIACAEGPADVLREENKQGREHLDAMTLALVRGVAPAFVAAARSYAQLLREHIRKEDSCLFPAAAQVFSLAEGEELLRGYRHVEKDEMSEGTHEDYLGLANTLAERLGVPRAGAGLESGPCCCHHVPV